MRIPSGDYGHEPRLRENILQANHRTAVQWIDMSAIRDRLSDNLRRVEERIAAACTRAGRKREEVTLVAVTKYVEAEIAAILVKLGVTHLGESRPQELWRKAAAVPQATWHLVGHLQRNKVERTLPLVTLIHSVDSIRLLEAIDFEAAKAQRTVRVLLEVNTSGEAAKHGFTSNRVLSEAQALRASSRVQIDGLMTMAAATDDPEQARPAFRMLRKLRAEFRGAWNDPQALPHLSMGMTGDFEVAIEEGATLVRIGSALFEGIEPANRAA
jgi:hypothetical protein